MPERMIYPTGGERGGDGKGGVVSERERETDEGKGVTLFLNELTVHPGRILEPEPEPGTSLEAQLF
jgi:hypothetical protein